jgi:3-dehydroquinate dehydratase
VRGRVGCRQSNHEGALVDLIQGAAGEGFDAVVLNLGAPTLNVLDRAAV